MQVHVHIDISKPKEVVWAAITQLENAERMISAITDLKVLNQPQDTLVGLKWQETREMFGQKSTETMWVTESVENKYYCTRAESHGSVYITKLVLSSIDENTKLTMSFSAQAQSWGVKIMAACMGVLIKGSMKKALYKDLLDIKNFLEKPPVP